MDSDLFSQFSGSVGHIMLLVVCINVLIHLIFSVGVAKDVGNFHKAHIQTQLVPGFAWVLATLIGGVFVGLAYWVMHHSTLARR